MWIQWCISDKLKRLVASFSAVIQGPRGIRAVIVRLKTFQETHSLEGLSVRQMIEEGRKY